MLRAIYFGTLILSLGLYFVACQSLTVHFASDGLVFSVIRMGSLSGWGALMLGWLPPYTIWWAANPLFVLGLIDFAMRQYSNAVRATAAALAISATTPVLLLFAEGLGIGFVFWFGSIATLAAGSFIAARLSRSDPTNAHVGQKPAS